MNVVREDVKQCVENELQHAVSVFGLHHSWHEKYAVMLEELQELKEEVNIAEAEIDSVWFGIRQNLPEYAEAHIHYVYERAVKAACEAIQVAAMAKKEIKTAKLKATKHTAMSGSNGYIAYTCGVCGKHVGRDDSFCGACGAYFGV
jgi:rubrerythrin